MAIEVIRKPTDSFTMECERCECVFRYNIDDLVKFISAEYVECPCCKIDIPHSKRKKYESDRANNEFN